MLTLSLPDSSKFTYAGSRFPDMDNLLRQTEFNRKNFVSYVANNAFALENEHILVGLLQMLAIDPTWPLDEVISYTRFRANSLCTTFNITSINHIGGVIINGFYRENVRELWSLIDNNKQYVEADIVLSNMCAVVPLYSTVTQRGYKHNLFHSGDLSTPPTDFAMIGIDLVELAVGWWVYMRQGREYNTGIASYCCQYPLVAAQLVHNQLAVVNILYEFLVKDRPLKELITTETVTFTTLSEEKLLGKYLTFIINWATGRTLVDIGQLLAGLKSIYYRAYPSYVPAGRNALFSQTAWFWEPQIMKLHAIYLSVANRMQYKASDVNITIDRVYPAAIGRFSKLSNPFCGKHLIGLAEEVLLLNKQNYK